MAANLDLSQPDLNQPRRTPLYNCHKSLGAKFTEFGGWEMPVLYTGLVDEHHAVRNAAGLFDVSHMGELTVRGPQAEAFLQYVTSNDVQKLKAGEAQYSLLLNHQGGVVDDIIVYKLGDNDYFLCVNAANTQKDFKWLKEQNNFETELNDVSDQYAQVAVQGPLAREILAKFLGLPKESFSVQSFKPFTFRCMDFTADGSKKVPLIIAATGYTGEDGFEIFCPADFGSKLWDGLLAVGKHYGLKPAGLGARDTLRLEVCYPLHGHELGDEIPALSSAVGWVIKFDKPEFIGKDALLKEKRNGLKLKLVGLEVLDRGIIREGAKLFCDGSEIGWVSSGTKPPTVDKAIGLGFVPENLSKVGTLLNAEVRGKLLAVKVIERPFYKRTSTGL